MLGNSTAYPTYVSPTTGRLLPLSNMTAQEVAEYEAFLATGGAASNGGEPSGISALPKWLLWLALGLLVVGYWKAEK